LAETIYILCTITSALCAVLLIRSYVRVRQRLLLWSGLCFIGLALNNVLLLVGLVIGPADDLQLARGLVALGALGCLLWGLIWEAC
jgi:hypothetical protein